MICLLAYFVTLNGIEMMMMHGFGVYGGVERGWSSCCIFSFFLAWHGMDGRHDDMGRNDWHGTE